MSFRRTVYYVGELQENAKMGASDLNMMLVCKEYHKKSLPDLVMESRRIMTAFFPNDAPARWYKDPHGFPSIGGVDIRTGTFYAYHRLYFSISQRMDIDINEGLVSCAVCPALNFRIS